MSLLPTHSPHDGAIAFVYRHVLHRDATPAERADWSAEMERGLSFDAFLDLVSASDEASSVAEGELDVAVAAVGNLFSIALGRRPTPADVAGWTAQLKAGRPLASFVDEVLDSPEARGRYEQPDRNLEGEAISFVYRHALGRDPTAGDVELWSRGLREGLSFPSFLVAVRSSDEGRARAATLAARSNADVIAFAYRHAVGREAAEAEVAKWDEDLRKGLSFEHFLRMMLTSEEARQRAAVGEEPPSADAIAFVYRHALGREPTEGDLRAWSAHLAAGLPFQRFLLDIVSSEEGRGRNEGSPLRSGERGDDTSAGDVIAFVHQQALGRGPSEAEVREWSGQLRGGLPFSRFLSSILQSDEAQARPAREPDEVAAESIAFVYRHAVGRDPTAADVAAWTDQFRSGLSFQGFLLGMLASEEARAHAAGKGRAGGTAEAMADGAEPAGDAIAFVYRHALGRGPTEADVQEWSGHLREGLSFPRFLRSILQSEEARVRPAREPDEVAAESIAFVYRHAVGRDPTAADVAVWTDHFRSGLPFQTFLLGMLASEEAQAHAAGKGRAGEMVGETAGGRATAEADGDDQAGDAIAFVYRHALGREPTEADVQEWSGHLRGGLSFPRFLRSMLESEEARARPAREPDEVAAESIAFVYRHAVGRDPTAADVAVWTDHFRSGLPFQGFLLGMLASEEARAHAAGQGDAGEMTDGQFVAHLFEICLGHCATPAQVQDWIRRFAEGGHRRADVAMSFIAAAIGRDELRGEAVWSHDPGSVSIMGTDRVLSAEAWAARAAEIEAGRNPMPPGRLSAPYVIRPHAIRVSAIASLYKGGHYIRKFLDNMTQQSLGENFELIVIDADSPDGEREVIETYQNVFRNIRYERMNYRIGIYDAWNVGVELARGEYLTNTNLDDLRRSDSLELQAKTLDAVPFADVVYQDFFYSLDPDLSFEEVEAFGFKSSLPIVTPNNLLVYNSPHNAPMWRKRLHAEVGLFDTALKSAGDHDFWLRCMRAGKVFYKINTPHVVYYQNPDGISTRPGTRGIVEGQRILKKYGRQLISPEIYRARAALSSDLSALTGAEVTVDEAEDAYGAVQRAVLSFAERHALAHPGRPAP